MAYDVELADRLRDQLAGRPGLSERRMFGGLAFLVGGHLAVGAASQGGLLLRCDPARTEALAEEDGVEPFVRRGRPMQGWLAVDTAAVTTAAQLRRWVAVGVDYAESLPPT